MMGLRQRLIYAIQCFFAVLARGQIPEHLVHVLTSLPASDAPSEAPESAPVPEAAPPPPNLAPNLVPDLAPDPGDRAVQLLALLQRDGRLIDFFNENITPFSDAQVGAAARNVHDSCRQVLERYDTLEPIIDSEEGQPVTVQDDIDPAMTKLIGNVTGHPPLNGVLRHRGWQATHIQLPPLPDGSGRSVVAPAEVEIP